MACSSDVLPDPVGPAMTVRVPVESDEVDGVQHPSPVEAEGDVAQHHGSVAAAVDRARRREAAHLHGRGHGDGAFDSALEDRHQQRGEAALGTQAAGAAHGGHGIRQPREGRPGDHEGAGDAPERPAPCAAREEARDVDDRVEHAERQDDERRSAGRSRSATTMPPVVMGPNSVTWANGGGKPHARQVDEHEAGAAQPVEEGAIRQAQRDEADGEERRGLQRCRTEAEHQGLSSHHRARHARRAGAVRRPARRARR